MAKIGMVVINREHNAAQPRAPLASAWKVTPRWKLWRPAYRRRQWWLDEYNELWRPFWRYASRREVLEITLEETYGKA